MVTLTSGVRLSYAEHGMGSGPPVLFLPGPTDSWRSYVMTLERLPAQIRAIAVSPRGHGDSDKPASGYLVEDFAGDVVDLLDATDIDRAVLVGHSGSCLVARRVAIDHPARIGGLVLEAAPTTLRGHAALQEFVHSVVPRLADPIDANFARSFVTDTSSKHIAAETLDTLVEDVAKVPARVWREMFSELLEYDDSDELMRVSAPTLLIWGDCDALVSREMQDILTDRVRSAELIVYAGVGHTPRWEDPQRFSEDVANLVQRANASCEPPGAAIL